MLRELGRRFKGPLWGHDVMVRIVETLTLSLT